MDEKRLKQQMKYNLPEFQVNLVASAEYDSMQLYESY